MGEKARGSHGKESLIRQRSIRHPIRRMSEWGRIGATEEQGDWVTQGCAALHPGLWRMSLLRCGFGVRWLSAALDLWGVHFPVVSLQRQL